MLQTKFKNQHIEQKITSSWNFQLFQFHFHYWVISKNVLIKTQKPQPRYCPDGLLVKLSVFQAECAGSNPQPMAMLYNKNRLQTLLFLLRMSLVKKKIWFYSATQWLAKLPWFVYAAYNTNTHPECYILRTIWLAMQKCKGGTKCAANTHLHLCNRTSCCKWATKWTIFSACTRGLSTCHTANSVHTNMYCTPFGQATMVQMLYYLSFVG